jgi:hypothetical protein
VQGEAVVNGHRLRAGDAPRYRDEDRVRVEQGCGAEVLVFDTPPWTKAGADRVLHAIQRAGWNGDPLT